MIIYIILFLISFFGTWYSLPRSIEKLKQSGFVAKDMYKYATPEVTTNLGIILLFTSFISISLYPLMARVLHFFFHNFNLGHDSLVSLSAIHLAFILVISIYSLYGLVDDLVDVGRILKLTLPVVFAYPLVSVVDPSHVWVPLLGELNLQSKIYLEVTISDIFRITVIPVYIMVVSNLVNMHSGFNGLQSGLSLIVLCTLTLKSIISNEVEDIFPIFSILGALSAFYLFNRFPSRAFEGNIGALFLAHL